MGTSPSKAVSGRNKISLCLEMLTIGKLVERMLSIGLKAVEKW